MICQYALDLFLQQLAFNCKERDNNLQNKKDKVTRPWIFNKLLGSQLPAGARPALQAQPVDESRKQLPAKRQWSPEHLMSFQSMWLDSNLIFLTFHGIRSHMKSFSRSLEGFGRKQHQHCWEFTILEQLHLTQLTIWNKNEKPWSFESFHLPFLGDARYNSSDAFPVLTRRKITKRRVVQSYHPKEIVPFRQLICLQQIYIYILSFWLTQQKSITKLKLKKNRVACLFLKVIIFVFEEIFPGDPRHRNHHNFWKNWSRALLLS